MGEPALPYRGRMPVFYYLSQQEAADIYQYLQTYPPAQADSGDASLALSTSRESAQDDPPAAAPPASEPPAPARIGRHVDDRVLLSVTGLLTMLLLTGGAALTVREMKKLAAPASTSKPTAQDYRREPATSIQRDLVA